MLNPVLVFLIEIRFGVKKAFLIILCSTLLVSCKLNPLLAEARKSFKGDWELTSITYPGSSGEYNVTLFNDASANCFLYSKWSFVSNNNTGSYWLTQPECSEHKRFFVWSINDSRSGEENPDLLLKPTDADFNSTSENQGYRINIIRSTNAEMVWEHTVTLEGEPFTVRMNFSKN